MNDKEPMYYLRTDEDDTDLPRKLYIEPTSMCNLNCSICFRHGWINEDLGHMDFSSFTVLADEIKNLPHIEEIFFGGMGEPLFHPDICKMISLISKNKKVSLLTNGTMLTEKMCEDLIKSGLSELWVSMDGFEKSIYESIQLGSRFDLIIKNLENFNIKRKGTEVRLCITFVVTRENAKQLQFINAFADKYGVDMLNISHMIPPSPINKEDVLYERTDIPVGKMRRFIPKANPTEQYVCPFIKSNSIFVKWNGEVSPCMQLLHGCYTYLYEEKREITHFSYGNIKVEGLMGSWNNPLYSEFRERVRIFYFPFCDICWGCDDRKKNLTDCVYGDSPTCGACLWASGKIFCP